MFYPELAKLPPILDFEASSNADESYPISAGLVVKGNVYYWIIKPKTEWIDWSLPSQAIHGLKRSFVVEYGKEVEEVFNDLVNHLKGYDVIYSDAPYWESLWLSRLGSLGVDVKSITELSPQLRDKALYSQILTNTFKKHRLTRHQADHDALAIALTIYETLE
jgi:hypothetical protein